MNEENELELLAALYQEPAIQELGTWNVDTDLLASILDLLQA